MMIVLTLWKRLSYEFSNGKRTNCCQLIGKGRPRNHNQLCHKKIQSGMGGTEKIGQNTVTLAGYISMKKSLSIQSISNSLGIFENNDAFALKALIMAIEMQNRYIEQLLYSHLVARIGGKNIRSTSMI